MNEPVVLRSALTAPFPGVGRLDIIRTGRRGPSPIPSPIRRERDKPG